MNILRLIETEYSGDTNPGNYLGPDIDAFGRIKNNREEVTHSPETEAERKRREREKEKLEQGGKVEESKRDVLDELLDDPKIKEMIVKILGGIHIGESIQYYSTVVDGLLEDLTTKNKRELAKMSTVEIAKKFKIEQREHPEFSRGDILDIIADHRRVEDAGGEEGEAPKGK